MKQDIFTNPEPIFGIHIDFSDNSQPIEYLNLNLLSAIKVLQEWSEKWILVPNKECMLKDLVWKWDAYPRKIKGAEKKDIETYSDVLDPNYIPEIYTEEEGTDEDD